MISFTFMYYLVHPGINVIIKVEKIFVHTKLFQLKQTQAPPSENLFKPFHGQIRNPIINFSAGESCWAKFFGINLLSGFQLIE